MLYKATTTTIIERGKRKTSLFFFFFFKKENKQRGKKNKIRLWAQLLALTVQRVRMTPMGSVVQLTFLLHNAVDRIDSLATSKEEAKKNDKRCKIGL